MQKSCDTCYRQWLDVSRDVCKRGGIDQESCMSACSIHKVALWRSVGAAL